ncbi:MAG: carboxypeptidase-like regulatory domain-containing protein [bacterium]|nr:carboxypeptidase-like regulatory domain-containing protein [bacterium]
MDFALSITDRDGAAVANADVLFGGSEYLTDSSGSVLIPDLPSGSYNFTVQLGEGPLSASQLKLAVAAVRDPACAGLANDSRRYSKPE